MSERRPFTKYFGDGVLVESGTYLGDGIQQGIDCGYHQILSYEVSPNLYNQTIRRFHGNNKVKIFFKSSATMSAEILSIPNKITFWLDGHYSSDGVTSYVDKYCPIMEELNEIGKHPRKDHNILVDDVRIFGTDEFNMITIQDVKSRILKINPNYKFIFEDGYIKNDVLVAYV
jgi:hypothetical protein